MRATYEQLLSISNNYVAAAKSCLGSGRLGLRVGLDFNSLPSGVRVEHAVWQGLPKAWRRYGAILAHCGVYVGSCGVRGG